ncbi:acyltransferase family protein [Microbispora hainanensis]|uniref:Acyltransferase n=1 Tax=Microbispora hainanensis TaxID=568844 RepID=A0A544YTX5_9ACTN|nr:acyltransferase [Microbispora hainanensis]TQS20214.1 acyltransferase [Microbispora hainanensis]
MESTAGQATAPSTRAHAPARLPGLDGIRGIAALFVVLHHCWLLSFPGFPADTGPAWAGWLVYGHLAVVMFIVLSGFSLAVSPARSGWRLNGLRRFAYRRAWRILPPYWAALLFSLVVAWTLIPQPGQGSPTAKSVLVYGLLVQDLFGSPSPNGAFWSIAVEAQLYVVFPLMLLVLRRAGATVLLAALTVVVALVGLLAPYVPAVDLFMRLTPQFAVLFAIGAVAAGTAAAMTPGVTARGEAHEDVSPWPSRLPWLALAAAAPVVLLIVLRGPAWTVAHYFWVDLAVGPAAGLLLASVAAGRPRPLVRLLDTRALRRLGSFSYSLYLIHAPIVVVVNRMVLAPRLVPGVTTFLATLVLTVPLALLAAWLFASVFELPFQRHRGWGALRAAVLRR